MSSSLPIPTQSSALGLSFSNSDTTFLVTSSIPVTVTEPSTTFTSLSETVFTSTRAASALPESQSVSSALQVQPVCVGDGVDGLSVGLLSTILLPTAIGLILWVRPASREPACKLTLCSYYSRLLDLGFVKCMDCVSGLYNKGVWHFICIQVPSLTLPSLRPKPLGTSLWAFLFPHVPLVPSISDDISNAGISAAVDAELFPSDEQLSQRTLWICFLVVLGWSILALAGLLPLYMVETPCLANSAGPSRFTGAYSVLQDMSLLRLIRLLDNTSVNTSSDFVIRAIVNGKDYASNARTRVIILTVLSIVLGVLPVLWKIIREFDRLVAYRRRFMDVKCQGLEMGWLSARYSPGFVGWGEKRLKDFIVKTGLSASLDENRNGTSRSRRRRHTEWSNEEKADLEVDVQSLFSIGWVS